MKRETKTLVDAKSGCLECGLVWTSRNAVAIAARHHDATGHSTWAEQVISTRYGADGVDHPDLFQEVPA